jgi:phage gpG-like protein
LQKPPKNHLVDLVGAALLKQVADEFRQSRDPYGKAWAPVKRTREKDRLAREKRAAEGKAAKADKPLVDSGRMRGSVSFKAGSSDLVRIFIPVDYASYHQQGTNPTKTHTRKGGVLAFDPKTNRFISKRRKRTEGMESVGVRFFKSYNRMAGAIKRRQMLPEEDTGGLGSIWTTAIAKVCKRAMVAWAKGTR